MQEKTNDPICGLTSSDKTLIIARESGAIQRYALPSVALVNKYNMETRPHHLAVNCNTTLLSIIDVTGLLQFIDLGIAFFIRFTDFIKLTFCQTGQEEAMREMFSSLKGRMCGI